MRLFATFRPIVCLLAVSGLAMACTVPVQAAGPIQSQAAVRVTFDAAGSKQTVPVVGKQAASGRLVGGAQLAASPFWAQTGKSALLLDASKKQFVQLTGVPYLDRADAVSLSFFFLNLHNESDAALHGIVAKQSADTQRTNYGMRYHMQNDALQLYVNDGSGFRVATFSANNVLGYRRIVHLTAVWDVGDAPGGDADTDRDNVRVCLFVNGEQAQPTKVADGLVIGSDAWLTNVDVAALLNDAPLTIGASTPDSEHTAGLVDELHMFTRALTASEAADLFREMAGDNADSLAQAELEPNRLPPSITSISLRGLQIGKTTRLTIIGKNLAANPRVELPVENLQQTIVKGSDASRLVVDLTLPADMVPGYFPLSVQTENGLSNTLPLAADRLPQFPLSASSAEKPAKLPAAFSGTLSGFEQARIYFRGLAGQRIVAEVEARRFGADLDPVLEIKTEQGTPLAVEWGKVFLKGDARAEVELPADGLYFAELHDLSYRAPGLNPFRILIGDLKIVDTYFPPAAAQGSNITVEVVGTGIQPGTTFAANLDGVMSGMSESLRLSPELGLLGPGPLLRLSDGIEVLEADPELGTPQTIDARFAENKHIPILINGRISAFAERDVYLLDVTPGQTINLRVDARSIDSPLDAELAVFVREKLQVVREDRSGSRDPAFDYQVPEDVKQIQLSIRDLHDRGGDHFLYRLRVIPAGQPDFSLNLTTTKLSLPADGTAIARLELQRDGYQGAINLSVAGDENVAISPSQIPAGRENRKVFVTLIRRGDDEGSGLRHLRIVGELVGLKIPIRRVAVMASGAGQVVVPGYQDLVPTAVTRPVGVALKVQQTPQTLLKALDTEIGIEVVRGPKSANRSVRLTLLSTEKSRPVDPKNAKKRNKPLVRALPNQIIPTGANNGTLKIAVPVDVAEQSIDFVLRGDILPHAFSQRIIATVYSEPFRLPVQNAVTVSIKGNALKLVGETKNKVSGTVKRASAFRGKVVIALSGFPKEYSAPQITVPADQENFELIVTAPKENEMRPLSQVTLSVTDHNGKRLQTTRELPVEVFPKAKGSGP